MTKQDKIEMICRWFFYFVLGFCFAVLFWACVQFHTEVELKSKLYARSGIVVTVDRESDIVEWEDGTGNVWSFCGSDDWEIGDGIACIINGQGTPTLTDDEVIGARYER